MGKKLDVLESLLPEYVQDEVYQKKVVQLHETYSHLRRMRPDGTLNIVKIQWHNIEVKDIRYSTFLGNCFFRAFSYSALEQLLGKPEEAKAFRAKVVASKEKLTEAGFTQFTVDDFYDELVEVSPSIVQSST